MDLKYARYLLDKTRQDYNLIAENYARTRAFIPEDIKDLGKYAFPGERVLDSGCANGRLFRMLKDKKIDYYGVDISERLIEIAKSAYPEAKFRLADALNLTFPSDFFDKVYSLSVLHNIPSKSFQIQYLKETKRVLKPGGFLILRVWDFWKRKVTAKLILKYAFLKLIGISKIDLFDVFVPWRDSEGKVLIERYFHCFTKRKLENLVRETGFKIKESWRAGKDPRTNIYLIAEKSSL